jgi:hypothetical protein
VLPTPLGTLATAQSKPFKTDAQARPRSPHVLGLWCSVEDLASRPSNATPTNLLVDRLSGGSPGAIPVELTKVAIEVAEEPLGTQPVFP